MKRPLATCCLLCVALSPLTTTNVRAADEPLAEAKALYAAAAFEDALTALRRLDPETAMAPAAMEYKVLCLLALGRQAEAKAATEALVEEAPSYEPEDSDLSPRYLTLLGETRQEVLPKLAKRIFADARDHFHANDQAKALSEFRTVLVLANDHVWKDETEAADLRTLAAGFVDLALAADPAPVPAARVPVPASPPAPATSTASRLPPVVTAPVPIRQVLPRWNPPDNASARREFSGEVRIVVGTDGHVASATIEKPTHPLYDALVLEAARTWLYKPGTRDGKPIEMERVLTVQLRAN